MINKNSTNNDPNYKNYTLNNGSIYMYVENLYENDIKPDASQGTALYDCRGKNLNGWGK